VRKKQTTRAVGVLSLRRRARMVSGGYKAAIVPIEIAAGAPDA